MKKKLTVNSDMSLSSAIGFMRDMYKDKKFITVTLDSGKARSISQNALSHKWYSQASLELQEYTPEEVKCLCKLHCGLNILRGADDKYNDVCVKMIDPLPYEDKIKAMSFFPVTSLMKTDQLSAYLEHIQKNYAGRVALEFPNEN